MDQPPSVRSERAWKQAAVAEDAPGDEAVGLAQGDERRRFGIGRDGGAVPGLRGVAVAAAGQEGEAPVAAPAALVALLLLDRAELGVGKRERQAELGKGAHLPSAGGDLVEEAGDEGRGIEVERAAGRLPPGDARQAIGGRGCPEAVDGALVDAGGGERGLEEADLGRVENGRTEGLEQRGRRRGGAADRLPEQQKTEAYQQNPDHRRTPYPGERLARGPRPPNDSVDNS